MAFKPNYNHQRAERNRAKEMKKQEKRQRREADVAKRKAAQDGPQGVDGEPEAVSVRTPLESADGP